MSVIRGARALTPDGWTGPIEIAVEDGRIAALRSTDAAVPDCALVPGFVDLQVNGHDDIDVATAAGADWDRLDDLLAAQGVTTWCPTLVTAPLEAYATPLDRIAEAATRRGVRPAIAGAHLEGPFLGGRPGAHPVDLVRPIDLDWLADLPEVVRMVTLAPEGDLALEAVEALSARGVLVSLGHSSATYERATAAVDAGARLATHCFNAMAGLHHRTPGLAGAALTDDRMAVSLIADLAHVHPAMLRLAFRAKGADGVVLVTDAVAWRSGRIGEIAIHADDRASGGDGVPRLADGTIAGSALRMDAAVRNVVQSAGVALADAALAASTTPARLLGLDDRGRLEVGARADVVALSAELALAGTWITGQRVA